MKRILVIAIIMIASINMIKAQGVCFGIKGGVNLENIIGLNSGQGAVGFTENESAKMTVGFHAGIFAKIALDNHWALVPEVLYTTGGAQRTFSRTYGGHTYTATGPFALSYLQIPIFVNYKFDCGFYLEGGPYLAFLVGSTTNYNYTDEHGDVISAPVSQKTDANGFDVGVGAGAGWRFCNGLGFNARYNYGLNTVYKDYSVDNSGISTNQSNTYGKNGVMQLSISYLFGCNGCTPKAPKAAAYVEPPATPAPVAEIAPVAAPDVQFSVQAPNTIPIQHVVIETLPLSDYVFFDAGSTDIPSRYTLLSQAQASGFAEVQLKDCQKDPGTRSSRQMKVYYNVLNIVGDRMRNAPSSTIKLLGSSAGKGVDIATANANSVKNYLVNNFGIDASRITVEGRNLPGNPSEIAGNKTDINLTSAEDNRVHIISTSTDLMVEVVGNSALCLKPVQVIANDGIATDNTPVSVTVAGASDVLKTWSVVVTDSLGKVQNFGPYTGNTESLSGETILGNNNSGSYTMVLTGQTNNGGTITKQSTFSLVREAQPSMPEQSASILFQFDKSVTVATFKNFLINTVAPLIPANSTVVISGHTDIIGPDEYNMNLSKERAKAAQTVLEGALASSGKTGVTYNTDGYGKTDMQFANILPEERFYNRTVMIDIIPSTTVVER
jgi:outer membrane protein OmpA-like peptidoglycan-associated protein